MQKKKKAYRESRYILAWMNAACQSACKLGECLLDSTWIPTGLWTVKMLHRGVVTFRTDFTLWTKAVFISWDLLLNNEKKEFNQVEFVSE